MAIRHRDDARKRDPAFAAALSRAAPDPSRPATVSWVRPTTLNGAADGEMASGRVTARARGGHVALMGRSRSRAKASAGDEAGPAGAAARLVGGCRRQAAGVDVFPCGPGDRDRSPLRDV